MGGQGIGPYISQLDTFDSDAATIIGNDGFVSQIIQGTGTLASGTVTITLPNGMTFANTKYKVYVLPSGTLITTADMLQEISASRTTTSFVIKSISSSSPASAATFSWVAIGQIKP